MNLSTSSLKVRGNYYQHMNLNSTYLVSLFLTTAIFLSCSNNDSKKNDLIPIEDSSASHSDKPNKNKPVVDTIPVISNKQIIGTWISLGKERLTVEISKSKFIYKEHNESYDFKIKSDSIYIYYYDLIVSGNPYLINDTFVIASENGERKYIRLATN